jgi:hypothetical protein
MTILFIDIETVPGCDWKAADLAADITAPAQYKKPESIAAWLAENRADMAREAEHKLGMHPLYCQVVAIGLAVGDGPVTVLTHRDPAQLLQDLSAYLVSYLDHPPTWVGHNLLSFDLPILLAQCVRHNVALPPYMPNPQALKPWQLGQTVVDTMLALKPFGLQPKGFSLSDMCRLFGIPDPMPDVDGSMVWDMWKAGDTDRLAEYCASDVVMLRKLFNRISPWLPTP